MEKKSVFDYEHDFYEQYQTQSAYRIGARTSHSIRTDPRHLLFTLSRYKFCAKMLEGKKSVLEVGCGDAIGAPIMLQTVGELYAVDIEPIVIEQNKAISEFGKRLQFDCHDFTKSRPGKTFDAVYSLDVIEHVDSNDEKKFLDNIAESMADDGVCIIGTPNITANQYASEISKKGHINLKSAATLKESLEPYFQHVFLFSMNDEVIHTGYAPMSHYLMALCASRKQPVHQSGK